MSRERAFVVTTSAVRWWLTGLWWVVIPPFALLAARLVYERTCAQPYELLPEVMSQSQLAWPLAILYLGAHCWAVGAYLVTVEHAGSLLPSRRAVKAFWGRHWPKVVVTGAIVAVEHAPVTLWRAVGHFLNCGS